MRRRQEEGMADAPHTNPNPTSTHIEYVSAFYFIPFHSISFYSLFNQNPTVYEHSTQTMRIFIEAKWPTSHSVTAMHLQIIKVQKFN